MGGVNITGPESGQKAEVNVQKELRIALQPDSDRCGFAAMVSEVDSGLKTGVRLTKAMDVNSDFMLRTATENMFFNDILTGTVLNLNKWETVLTSSQTVVVANGFATLNNSGLTTSGSGSSIRTYMAFPLDPVNSLYIQARIQTENGFVLNKVCEFGVGSYTAVGSLLDGAVFRWTAGGELKAVLSCAGAETEVLIDSAVSPDNTTCKFLIEYNSENVLYWIDDVLVAKILPAAAADTTIRTGGASMFLRTYNSGVPTLACKILISECCVTQGGCSFVRCIEIQQSGMHEHAYNGFTTGSLIGKTTSWANAAAPTAITALSNTALPTGPTHTNLLMGNFLINASATGFASVSDNTDFIIFGAHLPAASVTVNGTRLVIESAKLDVSVLGAAIATTPTILQWGIAFGGTALALNTADAAAAKAPRVALLGTTSWVVGELEGATKSIQRDFRVPLSVNSGEWVCLFMRVIRATATGSQVFRGVFDLNAFWE